jgi:5-methylcytosine-specific restriction enzyme B
MGRKKQFVSAFTKGKVAMILNESIATRIRQAQEKLDETGQILSEEQLAGYYRLFGEKFGPECLASLDGEALLNTMHDSSNRDSLVYWLEFKNDEEFPMRFGSIAGGSALKFGIYRRKETGLWTTGTPQKQISLSVEQAVETARKHRDQLLKGYKLLEALPLEATNAQYAKLQEDLHAQAPDISNWSWTHKYFSLLFPDKLDDYHNPDYQRFHLLKMLQVPVSPNGRYMVAGQYMAIARELGMHVNNLTRTLNELDGEPHQYWLVKANYSGEHHWKKWDEMYAQGFVAVGWDTLGDLSFITPNQESREQLKARMREVYNEKGGFANEVFNFVGKISIGDIVLAAERKDGADVILGIGKITGDYYHEPGQASHRKAVDWTPIAEYKLPVGEIKNRAVRAVSEYANIVDIESRLIGVSTSTPVSMPRKTALGGIPARIQEILERKRQVILYGPPGTGKTYWATLAARQIVAHQLFSQDYDSLTPAQQSEIAGSQQNPGPVQFCTFHPSYGYEDFIEGYKPASVNDNLSFELRPGIFKRICQVAHQNPQRKFILIIDEINRGDIPRIFGELITLLEKNKRKLTLPLPISGEPFSVPDNVYIIGTMNTADRSIALLDTALRRRFGFHELMPDYSTLGTASVDGIPLAAWLESLNQRILQSVGRDARNLQIGHAYLLENGRPVSEFLRFARILQEDILPLLEEYCYEDYDALEKILGRSLVDRQKQRIRHELFEPSRRSELVSALLSPEITTSVAAAKTEQEIPSDEEESEDQV